MGILLLAISIVFHSYWKYTTIYAAVPVIGNLPNSTSVSEGTGTEELLYVIDVTDADGDSIICTIDAGGGSNKFNLRLSTDANPSWSLYTVHGETYDPGSQAVYTLDIDCAANGDTVSSTYTINIVANLPPVITNLPDSVNVSTLTASIGDNVFTVTGTDTENDQMSYSISCSPVTPACPFTILASGAIQLNADISSSTHTGYDVTVTISDDSGSGVDKILTVLYTDINNPPQIQNLGSTISVPENTALGETVVTTDCSDSDASDTLVYTMSCTPASGSTYFLINSSSGVIYTSTTSNINYEFLGGTTSFACPVTCNDGRASDTETVTLSVTNVNEAPTLSQNAYSISADEGPAGTVILAAGFNVTDEDTGDTYSFSVDCGDSTGYFSIVTGTGVLSYSTDYDVDDGTRPSSISCNVTVTDSGGITDTAPLSIIINNINDNAPVFVYTSHVWFVSLDAAVGTVVGTAAATDADIGTFGDISYTLDQSNLTAEYFEIDSAGVVKVKNSVSGLSVGVLPSIYVYASDGGGTQTQATVTVFVTTTTTTTTTQATDRYKTFFDDSRNIAWFTACVVILLITTILICWMCFSFCGSSSPYSPYYKFKCCRIWDEPVRKRRNWGEYHRENYYRQMEPIRESRRPQRRPNGYQFWSTDN